MRLAGGHSNKRGHFSGDEVLPDENGDIVIVLSFQLTHAEVLVLWMVAGVDIRHHMEVQELVELLCLDECAEHVLIDEGGSAEQECQQSHEQLLEELADDRLVLEH